MNDPLTGPKLNVSGRQSSDSRRAAVHSPIYTNYAALSPHLAEGPDTPSLGATCHALKNRSSHILSSIGVPPDIALQTIRISFGVGNTEKDAVRIVQAIRAFIQHTREVLL